MTAPARTIEIRTARAIGAHPLIWPVTVVTVFMVLVACQEVSEIDSWTEAVTAADGTATGNAVNDRRITTRVKIVLFGDPHASGYPINVNTYRGVVQLSGFVDTRAQKHHVGELARRIDGVRKIHNDLIITSEDSLTISREGTHFNVVRSHQGANP